MGRLAQLARQIEQESAGAGGSAADVTLALAARRIVDKADNVVFNAETHPKIYKALLTQVGSAAPTAVVLENTLSGPIAWARTALGTFSGTLVGAFPAGKTWLTLGASVNNQTGVASANSFVRTSTDVVTLRTAGTDGSAADDVLLEVPVEIRVYP